MLLTSPISFPNLGITVDPSPVAFTVFGKDIYWYGIIICLGFVLLTYRLLKQGVKALVVACNTATSSAIVLLRQTHPELPIIGIEPAVKPAAQGGSGSAVLVMATPLTIREDKYQKLAASFCDLADVISLPCPGLAERIEQGHFEDETLDAYLQDLFRPYRDRDVEYIVLGCTHYPFIRRAIAKNFGRPVTIIDGSQATARQLRRQLQARGWLTRRTRPGTVTFQNSDPEKIALSKTLFLRSDIKEMYPP